MLKIKGISRLSIICFLLLCGIVKAQKQVLNFTYSQVGGETNRKFSILPASKTDKMDTVLSTTIVESKESCFQSFLNSFVVSPVPTDSYVGIKANLSNNDVVCGEKFDWEHSLLTAGLYDMNTGRLLSKSVSFPVGEAKSTNRLLFDISSYLLGVYNLHIELWINGSIYIKNMPVLKK